MEWYVILIRIVLSIVVGLGIGIEREYKNRPAGMRTHVLVSMGACIVALMECLFLESMMWSSDSQVTYSFGRLAAQVITGVGFLGAGTIFTASKKIVGLTTAASLWNAACLGIAVGYGYYFIAIAGGGLVLIVLMAMQKIVHVNAAKKIEIKFVHRVETIDFINAYFDRHGIRTLDLDFSVDVGEERNIYKNTYTLNLPQHVNYTDIVNDLSEYVNVLGIRTTHA
ncbi:MAG: MgtC/SapB family protein [Christensenellales bacterium]|jgi:putative Mg2+ transporter-C (MgtC) family protein